MGFDACIFTICYVAHRDERAKQQKTVIMSEKDITKSAASGIAKLDRLNYVQWCIDVQLLLEEKGIWQFVQGKQVEPELTAPTTEKAKFTKEKNKSWAIILQSLVPRLQPAAMKKDTAQAVWEHLKKLFEPSFIARETSLVETFYCMRRNEGKELDSFISRLEKAEDDMVAANAALKPVDHVKAYQLISRVGKEFENQIQSIYQWQKTEFTYEKVLTALLNEHNRRKLVENNKKSLEAASAFLLSQKATNVKSDSKVQSSDNKAYLQSIICYKCGLTGDFARDCTKSASTSEQSVQRGRGRGRRSRRGRRPSRAMPGGQAAREAWFAHAPTVLDSPSVSSTCSLHGILDDGLYRVKGPVQYKPAMKPKSIDINYSGTKDCEKRPLSLGHLKVPGSLVYVHIPKPDRHSKLEPRAWKGVMVGYAMGTRGYRLWDPISNNVYESKHVKFDELRIYKDVVQTVARDYFLFPAFSFLPRFSQDGACEVLLPINKLFYMFGLFEICLRPPRAFTRPKKYAKSRRRFRDVVRESKFTYVSQKPLVPHAAGIQRELPTSYRSKAPFGALLVFTLLRKLISTNFLTITELVGPGQTYSTTQTYVGDTPLDISNGRDTHFIPHVDSDDSDDDDTPPPLPQAQLPTRPPSPPLPKPPLPITPKPLLIVTTRRKVMPSSSAQSGTAPTRVALRAPMLSKPGWEQEEVKRHTDDFDWVPSQEKPGYLTSDDDEAQERPRYKEGDESSGTNVSVVTTLGMCKDSELETEFPYRSLVGSLMFLASRTRPDILYSTIYLSQFNNHHSIKHIKCLLQILQYVVNTSNYCINLNNCKRESLYLYTDASWATNLVNSKSFGGYILYLGGSVIGWGCKVQYACSSMESEYTALSHAAREAYWVSCIFENCALFNRVNIPVIHSDSISSIQFATNDIENTKTKHIRIQYHFLRNWFEREYFKLAKVPGEYNIADIFTKWLSNEKIKDLCETVFDLLSD
uniref:CCHC-type domain-containing protein n=1 Tax=Strigamia maritima TaxID=126957 RepID=T1IVY9_STRMM